ncbi:hypothetical protein LguiA_014852 [Lonicera macranthoides]
MSGRNNGGGGGGIGVQSIPSASRKMVQSLKEIVNCSDSEIYAVLKECNMDPNEAVSRLLSQDPFHEVKSKREKKKENKDSTESRSRGASSTLNRGARSGSDRYGGRGGSTQFSSSDYGALHGKPANKKENGTHPYTSFSSPASGMPGNNTNWQPSTPSESFSKENKSPTISAVDVISSPPHSSGYQPAWVGVPGQISMADIVKKGRPQSKPNTQHLVQAPPSNNDWPSSEDYGSKVTSDQHVPVEDEWPLMPPPVVSVSSVINSHADSELHEDESNLPIDRINQNSESQTDEVEEPDDDGAIEDLSESHVGSVSVSSRKMHEDNSGGSSLFDSDLYKNMGSYQPQNDVYEHQEVEDVGASVSLATANLQELSILDEDRRSEEGAPSLVIPNHLQVEAAECSHLSFGSFGSGINTALSRPVRSNMEEAPTVAEASSVGHLDTRNAEYYGDEALRIQSEGNLVHRTGASAGSYDSPPASQPEMLKQENADVGHGNQYMFQSSTSGGYAFENAQELNAALNENAQMNSQMQNLAPFSNQAYTDSLPSAMLAAANANLVRESDIPYSPFPVQQSMPTKYGTSVSSISGSTISVAEALKTAGFSSTQPTQQQTQTGTSVATGPALPQHLVHPYSQPTLPLGPFANMIGYPFLPQSYTYMPSGFQQAFAGNNTYHQSLAAAALPQYKNSVSVSSLPQSAAVPSAYGPFGSSTSIPANYPMNPPAGPAGTTISYEDLLSSQYKDSSHLISLQQAENPAMWLHGGPGSRTMSAVPASTYYSYQGQNHQQPPAGFRQAQQQQQPTQNYGGALGYPNFYHSQAGVSLEQHQQQQQQNPRDGSHSGPQGQPKQSQQIWQNNY